MDATDFTFANMTCTDFSRHVVDEAQFGPLQNIPAGRQVPHQIHRGTIDVNAIAASSWE